MLTAECYLDFLEIGIPTLLEDMSSIAVQQWLFQHDCYGDEVRQWLTALCTGMWTGHGQSIT
jgi:hypothetical protein